MRFHVDQVALIDHRLVLGLVGLVERILLVEKLLLVAVEQLLLKAVEQLLLAVFARTWPGFSTELGPKQGSSPFTGRVGECTKLQRARRKQPRCRQQPLLQRSLTRQLRRRAGTVGESIGCNHVVDLQTEQDRLETCKNK